MKIFVFFSIFLTLFYGQVLFAATTEENAARIDKLERRLSNLEGITIRDFTFSELKAFGEIHGISIEVSHAYKPALPEHVALMAPGLRECLSKYFERYRGRTTLKVVKLFGYGRDTEFYWSDDEKKLDANLQNEYLDATHCFNVLASKAVQ